MTNDEARMTKEILSPNAEKVRAPSFELCHSLFLRHSCFVIRHLSPLEHRASYSDAFVFHRFPFVSTRPRLMRFAKIRMAPGTPSGN